MKKLTNVDIIARLTKLYNNKYDLSMVNYTGPNDKLTLICPIHGKWAKMAQKIFGHGKSKVRGCPKCSFVDAVKNRSYNKLKTTSQFIAESKQKHSNVYDYSLVNYVNTDTKVDIKCPSHGIFKQLPWGHLKYGCRACGVHKSNIEKQWIQSLNIPTLITQHSIPEFNFTVDGYDPVTNTIYEFYGDYWHGNPEKFDSAKINTKTPKQKTFGQLYSDTIAREKILKDAGYNIVSIWESNYR